MLNFLGVPYVIGFQSNSSAVGEALVHLYEYGMCMLMIVLVFVVKFFMEGVIWFTRREKKVLVEVWFVLGRFLLGMANRRVLEVLLQEAYWKKNSKKNIYKNKKWFKYRGKSKIYLYKMLETNQESNLLRPRLWNKSFVIYEVYFFYFLNLLLSLLEPFLPKAKKGIYNEILDNYINFNFELEYNLSVEIKNLIWDFFHLERVSRYELWYHHYTFTGVIWTFLDWNYMRMRKCFKFCEYSNWDRQPQKRANIIKSLGARSMVKPQFSRDVYFNKDKQSEHILELESFPERNLNLYFYGVSAVQDIRMETWWTLSPGALLFFWWFPTLLVVYSQGDFLAPMYSFNVAGKQWSWLYEIANLNVKNQSKLPGHLNMFDTMGINEPGLAFVKLQMAWRVITILDTTALEFRSNLVQDINLHPGLLRLLETNHWIGLKMNMELRVLISGIDVIHSFGIQGLGCKMDAVPGRVHGITVFLKRPGMFYGQCSELCGVEHGYMPIAVEVVKLSLIKGSKFGIQWI